MADKVYILGGIAFKSAKMAEYMAKNAAAWISLAKSRRRSNPKRTAAGRIRIAVELQALREIKGVHGVHIMAIEWEEVVPQIVEESKLFPRPQA